MGFILMYDVTNEESFNSVQDWYVSLLKYSSEKYAVTNVELMPSKTKMCKKIFPVKNNEVGKRNGGFVTYDTFISNHSFSKCV